MRDCRAFLATRTIYIFLLLIFLVQGDGQKPYFQNLPRFAVSYRESLRCEQILPLALWSQERFGGGRTINVRSSAFSTKALRLFLEKIDPQKLLFTQGDLLDLQRRGLSGWRAMIDQGDCAFFTQWLDSHYLQAHERLLHGMSRTHLSVKFPKPQQKAKESVAKYKHFAKSEEEIYLRVAKAVQAILKEATPGLRFAYQENAVRYVQDTLQAAVVDNLEVHSLLAKSVLGAFDLYSTYLSAEEYEDFYDDLSGEASGIGIQVRKVPSGFLVEKLLKDSPAHLSGLLKKGDLISKVEGLSMEHVTPVEAKRYLKGGEGTWVKLEVERLEGTTSHTFSALIQRKRFLFEESKISSRLIEKREKAAKTVGVINVPSFYGRGNEGDVERSSAGDLEEVVAKLMNEKKKVDSMVLDLRGNPGGFLEEAVSMAGLFIGDRPVVGVVENDSHRILRDHRPDSLYSGPLVVLVDNETASAGEVLAGALKDHQRALVVGTVRTYGKGSVQRLFHLEDEFLFPGLDCSSCAGVVKLTTSLFYSPLGHSPTNGGIQTHIAYLPETKDAESPSSNPVHWAPAVESFVEEEERRELTQAEPRLEKEIGALREKSFKRIRGIREADQENSAAISKHDLKETETDPALDEAIQIALDHADWLSPSSPAALKWGKKNSNAAVSNSHRDVIGY